MTHRHVPPASCHYVVICALLIAVLDDIQMVSIFSFIEDLERYVYIYTEYDILTNSTQ